MMMAVMMMIMMIRMKMVTKVFFFSALPVRGVQSMLLSVRSLDIIIIMGSDSIECYGVFGENVIWSLKPRKDCALDAAREPSNNIFLDWEFYHHHHHHHYHHSHHHYYHIHHHHYWSISTFLIRSCPPPILDSNPTRTESSGSNKNISACLDWNSTNISIRIISITNQPPFSAISPLRMLAVKQQKPEVRKAFDLNDDGDGNND